MIQVNRLVSPLVFVLATYIPALIAFIAIPKQTYVNVFASQKNEALVALLLVGLSVAAFAVGVVLGGRWHRVSGGIVETPSGRLPQLDVLVWLAIAGALVGYVVWFALALHRAGGPVGLLWHYEHDDAGTVKRVYFATVPGVTTLSQLAVAAVPLCVAAGMWGRSRLVRVSVGVLLVFGLVRSVLASERLALIELVVPVLYVLVWRVRLRPARLAACIAVLVLAVVAFFSATEFHRTLQGQGFSLQRPATRFTAYYLNSLDNGMAIAKDYRFATPCYFTLTSLWAFPGVSATPLDYTRLTGVSPGRVLDNFHELHGLTPTVTTLGLPGSMAMDWGWLAPLVLLGLGVTAGAIHRSTETSVVARVWYGIWLVGLLEFWRTPYLFNQRLAPPYAVLLVAFLLLRGKGVVKAAQSVFVRKSLPLQ